MSYVLLGSKQLPPVSKYCHLCAKCLRELLFTNGFHNIFTATWSHKDLQDLHGHVKKRFKTVSKQTLNMSITCTTYLQMFDSLVASSFDATDDTVDVNGAGNPAFL